MKKIKKLRLTRETLRQLDQNQQGQIAGGSSPAVSYTLSSIITGMVLDDVNEELSDPVNTVMDAVKWLDKATSRALTWFTSCR